MFPTADAIVAQVILAGPSYTWDPFLTFTSLTFLSLENFLHTFGIHFLLQFITFSVTPGIILWIHDHWQSQFGSVGDILISHAIPHGRALGPRHDW